VIEVRRCGDLVGAVVDPDVGQGRERVDQQVAQEDGCGAQLDEDRLGPTTGEEVALRVGVAAPLSADVEVDLLTGPARRLADMAAAARSATIFWISELVPFPVSGKICWINGSVALNVPPKEVPVGRSFGWPVLMSMRSVRTGS
jgi:hypothetical protein